MGPRSWTGGVPHRLPVLDIARELRREVRHPSRLVWKAVRWLLEHVSARQLFDCRPRGGASPLTSLKIVLG